VRRWWAVAVIGAAWPLYFAGLLSGLWGFGVGDGWQLQLGC
jgi:hypothetical protein